MKQFNNIKQCNKLIIKKRTNKEKKSLKIQPVGKGTLETDINNFSLSLL